MSRQHPACLTGVFKTWLSRSSTSLSSSLPLHIIVWLLWPGCYISVFCVLLVLYFLSWLMSQVMTVVTLELCQLLIHFLLFFISRWRYGSKTNDPNTKRLWRMALVDLKGSTLLPNHSPPLLHAPCGTSAWLPKGPQCTLEDTLTILLTGTLDTNRTPCRGLRWCDTQEGTTHYGQNNGYTLISNMAGAVRDIDNVSRLSHSGGKNIITGRDVPKLF